MFSYTKKHGTLYRKKSGKNCRIKIYTVCISCAFYILTHKYENIYRRRKYFSSLLSLASAECLLLNFQIVYIHTTI